MKSSGSFVLRLVRRTAFWDACLLLVIVLGGALLGGRSVTAFQKVGREEFGQSEFGAAVALACGRGFVNPVPPGPALAAFLARSTDTFSCDQLPANMPSAPPNFTQKLYRYLMVAVALEWKWSGVSWSRLTPLFGIVFGLTLGAAYGLFRLAGGPLVAALGVIPLAVSAHHLGMLPELRDYAKAPFILLLVLLMARIAQPPYSRVRVLAWSAVFGLALGIGFGFRNDILINVPPFIAVIAVLLPVAWREELRVKAACLGLASLVFVVSAWPILRAYESGSNTGHVAVLGLMTPFDAPLGLTRPPYDIGTHYDDRFGGAVIGTRGSLRTGRFAEYLSPEYDREALALTLSLARHWPADIFVRGLASTLEVFDFPFSTSGRFSPPVPAGVTGAFATGFYEAQASLLKLLTGLGPLLAAVAIIVIGSANARHGVALILLTLYYCGYPAIQFHIRHYFHLEFVVWWALVFLIAGVVRVVGARVRREAPRSSLRTRATGAFATLLAMAAVIALPLWTLRLYQQAHVLPLLETIEREPRTPVTLSRAADGDYVSIALNGLWDGRTGKSVSVRYLAAEFSAEQCGATNVPLLVKYDTAFGTNDFSTLLRVVIDPRAPTHQFVPVFDDAPFSRFAGLRMPAGYDACLKSVGVVTGAGDLPAPMGVSLTPDANQTTWFQRLARWENGASSPYPVVHARPSDLVSPRTPAALTPPLRADVIANGLTPLDRGWSGVATAYVAQSRLLYFAEQDIPAGAVLRATGALRRGGLQIGILQNELWLDMQTVDTAGPFTVLVRAPQAGRYGVLVADTSTREWRLEQTSLLHRLSRHAAPWLLKDDFTVNEIAWTRPGA